MRRPLTIVVVDDNCVLRESIGLRLSARGFNVLVGENGAQALSLVQSNEVDVLLTDLEMPGLDGLALCRLVGAAKPNVAMFLMTGRFGFKLEHTSGSGVSAVLIKPFREQDLFDLLGAVSSSRNPAVGA